MVTVIVRVHTHTHTQATSDVDMIAMSKYLLELKRMIEVNSVFFP